MAPAVLLVRVDARVSVAFVSIEKACAVDAAHATTRKSGAASVRGRAAAKAFLDEVAPDRVIPPNTEITVGPAKVTPGTTANFVFGADQEDSKFTCSLDSAKFTRCTSPTTIPNLAPGAHVFLVRATDSAGNVDRTPRAWKWTVAPGSPR